MSRYFRLAADAFLVSAILGVSLYAMYLMCNEPEETTTEQTYTLPTDVRPTLDQDL